MCQSNADRRHTPTCDVLCRIANEWRYQTQVTILSVCNIYGWQSLLNNEWYQKKILIRHELHTLL